MKNVFCALHNVRSGQTLSHSEHVRQGTGPVPEPAKSTFQIEPDQQNPVGVPGSRWLLSYVCNYRYSTSSLKFDFMCDYYNG